MTQLANMRSGDCLAPIMDHVTSNFRAHSESLRWRKCCRDQDTNIEACAASGDPKAKVAAALVVHIILLKLPDDMNHIFSSMHAGNLTTRQQSRGLARGTQFTGVRLVQCFYVDVSGRFDWRSW